MHNRLIAKDDAMATPLLLSTDECSRDNISLAESSVKLKRTDLLQKRYILVLLCILGVFNIYSTRVSISIGLVCMINHTAVLRHSRNYVNTTNQSYNSDQAQTSVNSLSKSEGNAHPSEDGPFVWDEEVQGIILSSFFWGYATTQLAGGYLADKYGGKWVWGFTLLIASLLTMLIPYFAHFNTALLIFTRVLCGAAQGFTFPTLVSILSKWAPVQERARLFALSLLGIPIGIIATYSLAPVLCNSHLLGGWPLLFYVFGFLGIFWFVLWTIFMYDHPFDHPYITDKEKLYIASSNMCDHKSYLVQIPWTSILKSTPLWALAICEFCHAYKYLMIITQLPTYLKVVMNFSLQENGIYSSVPQFVTPLFAVLASWIADVLIIKEKMSVGTLRKSATLAGFGLSSVCLLGVTLLSSQKAAIVSLIWISSFMDGFVCAGFEMSPYDMSPNFAGTIKGIVHTFAAIGGMISPYVIGILTKNNNTKAAWNTAFHIAIGLYMFGGITFALFASGEIQPWNNVGNASTDDRLKKDTERLVKNTRGKIRKDAK